MIHQLQKILPQITSIAPKYCDKCGTKHKEEDFMIVGNNPGKLVCKLNCANCSNSYTIQVNMSKEGIMSKRTSSRMEITKEEYDKFASAEAIGREEVLDVYMSLEKVESMADLESLLKE